MAKEILASRTAVVVVDMQNDFVRAGAPMEISNARKTFGPINKTVAAAREKGMPIIYIKFISGPKRTLIWDYTPQIEKDHLCWRGVTRKYQDRDEELPVTDIVDELAPKEGDYIVEKYSYNSFVNTNLIDILHAENVNTIIVLGTVTNICVGNTVYGAFQNNIEPIVGRDAVSSWDDELNDATLKNIDGKYGLVLDVDEIIARLK